MYIGRLVTSEGRATRFQAGDVLIWNRDEQCFALSRRGISLYIQKTGKKPDNKLLFPGLGCPSNAITLMLLGRNLSVVHKSDNKRRTDHYTLVKKTDSF
ncbi:hypothetical protein KBD34_00525 [Patescibacteria group bacterium]|nr:hypothetical protein [Patescibacteria group bacterium]